MNLFQRYLADEFAEDYSEGRISRREALKLITSVTGSLVLANSILAGCAAPEETVTPAAIATEVLMTDAVPASPSPSAAPVSTGPASPAPPMEL